MNRTLEVKITNGTLFINDDITIEFAEANLKMDSELNKFSVTEDIKPTPKVLPPINKGITSKTTPSKNVKKTRGDSTNKERLMEFITENGETPISKIIAFASSELSGFTIKSVKNFLYTGKFQGKLLNPTKGIYTVAQEEKKNEKKVSTKSLPVVAKQLSIPEVKQEVAIEEETKGELKNDTYHIYNSGTAICYGDHVKILPAEEAKQDDDILSFDDEIAEQFGVVEKGEEGSNMIKIKLNRTGREVLVYPHWIKLVNRSDK